MTLFETAYCSGSIDEVEYDQSLKVTGRITEAVKDGKVTYVAAAPPDYRATFTGSGLPFFSQKQAFEDTPNAGVFTVDSLTGAFELSLMTPNAYYVGLATVYVPPTLYLEYETTMGQRRNISIRLSDGIPYRSLTWPGPGQKTRVRQGPQFYDTQFDLPVRTQEQILRDSAYPAKNTMAPNFWGLKPPL